MLQGSAILKCLWFTWLWHGCPDRSWGYCRRVSGHTSGECSLGGGWKRGGNKALQVHAGPDRAEGRACRCTGTRRQRSRCAAAGGRLPASNFRRLQALLWCWLQLGSLVRASCDCWTRLQALQAAAQATAAVGSRGRGLPSAGEAMNSRRMKVGPLLMARIHLPIPQPALAAASDRETLQRGWRAAGPDRLLLGLP